MTNEQSEDKNPPRFSAFLLLFVMLVGFLLGFLLHDFLVEQNPIPRDIKSWYPR